MQLLTKATLVVLVTATASAAAFSVFSQDHAADVAQDFAAVRAQLHAEEGRSSILERAAEFGIETGSVGLHLLRPETTPSHSDLNTDMTVGDFIFWGMSTQAIFGELNPSADPQWFNHPLDVQAFSITRIVTSGLDTLYKVPSPTTPGQFALRWNPSEETKEALKLAHGQVTSNSAFVDWAGVAIYPGQSATPMFGSLVMDNRSYGMLDITSIVVGIAAADFQVADRLQETTADTIVSLAQ